VKYFDNPMNHLPSSSITMPDLVDYIIRLRASGKPSPVILAFCFSDVLALKACLSACQETRSIPVIMATMNQVNSDGGYSGLTSADFVRRVYELACDVGYDGPVIFGRDHGGPYIVAAQKTIPRPEVMKWVKHNITQDLNAGFTCWHADGTSGKQDEQTDRQLSIELIADITLEMIGFCESERKRLGIPLISYEIGSEEQQGGLTLPKKLDAFLKLIVDGISQKKLTDARIDFIVAQTGTQMNLKRRVPGEDYRLFQDGFNPVMVKELDQVAETYRTDQAKFLFTQHYSDQISSEDAESLLTLGIGKANFGPEMTMPELKMLLFWEKQSQEFLARQDRIDQVPDFRQTMIHELDKNPEFWRDYIPSDQHKTSAKSLSAYDTHVQDAVMIFRGRYVKNRPRCAESAKKLLKNIVELGIHASPAEAIVEKIKTTHVIPRIKQLRMGGIQDTLPDSLICKTTKKF
jgi:D-tagatose-1,6-bisphosphate aldolase subunit GatZ/KbaZ